MKTIEALCTPPIVSSISLSGVPSWPTTYGIKKELALNSKTAYIIENANINGIPSNFAAVFQAPKNPISAVLHPEKLRLVGGLLRGPNGYREDQGFY